jgi:hypothetical protein
VGDQREAPVAVEAERREEVQRGVEALVREGQLSIVGLEELRGLLSATGFSYRRHFDFPTIAVIEGIASS